MTVAAEQVERNPAARALEYATPLPGGVGRSRRELWLGIPAALFVALGVGLAVFGMLMASGMRDDYAGPIGGGVGCMMFGANLIVLMVWLRRQGR